MWVGNETSAKSFYLIYLFIAACWHIQLQFAKFFGNVFFFGTTFSNWGVVNSFIHMKSLKKDYEQFISTRAMFKKIVVWNVETLVSNKYYFL